MPFVKGQSGNPSGRPKSKPFSDALKAEIEAAGDETPVLREIARKLLDKAREGDMQAIKELGDRLDGKPAQEIQGTLETTNYVARMPEQCSTSEEWRRETEKYRKPTAH